MTDDRQIHWGVLRMSVDTAHRLVAFMRTDPAYATLTIDDVIKGKYERTTSKENAANVQPDNSGEGGGTD